MEMLNTTIPEWARYTAHPLPCPFCGTEPWGVFGEPGDIIIECGTDTCGNVHYMADTKEEAVAMWNTRPAQCKEQEKP